MRRPMLALLAFLLLAPFLAGCGDDGSSEGTSGSSAGTTEAGDDAGANAGTDLGGAVELIRSAPDTLADAGTAHLEMTVDTAGFALDARGQFDFEAQQGAMTMSLPAPAEGEIEMVFDGTTYFMSADALGGAVPGVDAEWIRVDLEDLAGQTGMDLSQLPQGTNNPAQALDALAAVSEDGLEEVGTDEVRGVDTTHYTAEIDMAAAVEQANEDAGGGLLDPAFADQFLAQYGDEPVPVELWIDEDGLVHRQTMAFEAAGQEVAMTMEMFDYGEPVDIRIPSEDEAVDFAELLGSIGSGSGSVPGTVPGG